MNEVAAATVEIEGLTVRYGRRTALSDVSLSIGEGVVGLLGPNGAGKSTLLKTLLGFCRPAAGAARLFGMPIREAGLEARRRIGYMPERDVTSPKLSAVSFVSFCGCLAGMRYRDSLQRTHEVLNYVGLGEERYRRMETYSTGMRQRAKLAQALVHDPRLLFLDEPTNGLDPIGRVAMLELIKDIARLRKASIILSSHLFPDVEHVCERVIVLDQGRVVQEGLISELTRLKGAAYSVRVKEDAEDFARALAQRGISVAPSHDGALVVQLDDRTGVADVFRVARQGGFQVRELLPVRQRLEEVFIDSLARDVERVEPWSGGQ
jgi:ABC-2 type transport system ATP-binding protein